MNTARAIRLALVIDELRDQVAAASETTPAPDDLSTHATNAIWAHRRGDNADARECLLETAATAILLLAQLDQEATPAPAANLVKFPPAS